MALSGVHDSDDGALWIAFLQVALRDLLCSALILHHPHLQAIAWSLLWVSRRR